MRLQILAAAVAAFGLIACQDGDMEEAGENIDNTIEESTDGTRDLTDGAAENLGEDLSRAGDEMEEGVRDAGNAVERELEQAREDAKD